MSCPAYILNEREQKRFDFSKLEHVFLHIGLAEEDAKKFRGIQFPFELMPHQIHGIHSGMARPRMGLFDEARCGKTPVMHALSIYFAKYEMKTITLMPPALFHQFDSEFKRIKGHGITSDIFRYSPKKREDMIAAWKADHRVSPDLLIMSKDIFVKHHTALRVVGYQVLIVDEAHMGLGKEKNHLYHAIRSFTDNVVDSRLILATGTPIPNNLYDVYPIISLKTPGWYKSRRHFDNAHVTFKQMMVRTPRGEKLISIPDNNGYVRLDMLHEAVRFDSVRALKAEVLNIKAPNVQIVPVELSKPHMAAYRQLVKGRLAEVDGEIVDARVAQKLRQVSLQAISDPDFITDMGTVKSNSVIETTTAILDSVGAYDKTKVVLFANYNNTVELLERTYRKKYSPAVIYGPNGSLKNQSELKRFQENGLCRLLIANPISGGVGVTAGHVSQTAIFVEPVSTPGAFDQAASRVMLVGQKEPVSVYILRVDGTISPKLIDLMMGKIQDLNLVMKDKKTLFDNLLGKA